MHGIIYFIYISAMGNNISHLAIWDEDTQKEAIKKTIGALGILDHFSDEEKERWIVIVYWWHQKVWFTMSSLLANALADKHVVLVYANEAGEIVTTDDMLAQTKQPTIEDFIQKISDNIERSIVDMSDDIEKYRLLEKVYISFKKEQEKRRRRHLHKKKVSTRKKG